MTFDPKSLGMTPGEEQDLNKIEATKTADSFMSLKPGDMFYYGHWLYFVLEEGLYRRNGQVKDLRCLYWDVRQNSFEGQITVNGEGFEQFQILRLTPLEKY